MYPNLKLQIWKSGVRQNRLAQMVGIHETLLSKIVNGFRAPDAECRTRIARALESDEEWLFATRDTVLDHLHPEPSKMRETRSKNDRKGRSQARTITAPGGGPKGGRSEEQRI
jgi:transcriptional regulator with XRE-family HTH domain